MSLRNKSIAALLGLLISLPTVASAGVIGGTYYDVRYDYREFFAATDGRNFQVVLEGTPPFPGVDRNAVASALLPMMQSAKPRPALTFTYDAPVETPRPNYRLVLIFDPANDLGGDPVCQGVRRFKPRRPGIFFVYAVYCRNDQRLSETTAWTPATSPNDPRIEQLFRELFEVVFSDLPALRPQIGGDDRR